MDSGNTVGSDNQGKVETLPAETQSQVFDFRKPGESGGAQHTWGLSCPVFFVGFMGAGKTSTARKLARKAGVADFLSQIRSAAPFPAHAAWEPGPGKPAPARRPWDLPLGRGASEMHISIFIQFSRVRRKSQGIWRFSCAARHFVLYCVRII